MNRCLAFAVLLAGVVAFAGVGVSLAGEQAEELQDVESTLIKEIGYDADSQVLTVVMVQSGDVYEYQGVPQAVYDGLMQAESKGSYFVKNIKGKYSFSKK